MLFRFDDNQGSYCKMNLKRMIPCKVNLKRMINCNVLLYECMNFNFKLDTPVYMCCILNLLRLVLFAANQIEIWTGTLS